MEKKSAYSQDTETRILEAAEKEFFEKGYAGARTASIAEAAGVTHAMLHYYFRTKDQLFERVVSGKMNMLGNIVLSAIGDDDLPLEDRIRQGVERHFDFIASNRNLPRFIINEVCTHPERVKIISEGLRKMVNGLLDNLQREIDEYAGRGLCERIDARVLMIDIVSLNVFPLMAAPMLQEIVGNPIGDANAFLEMRKRENVETILRKLKIR